MIEQPAGDRWRPYLNALGTVFALILLLILFRSQGWDEIIAALRSIPFWRLSLGLLVTFISRMAVTARWHTLLMSSDLQISFWQTTKITFAGLFASQFLPTTVGGDVVRLAGILRLGKDRAVSLASLVVDRLVGMAGMAMAAILLVGYLPDIFRDLFAFLPDQRLVSSLLIGFGVSGQVDSLFLKVRKKVQGGLRKLGQALIIWWRKPLPLLVALLFTWIHMVCIFASIWILLPALDEQIPFGLIAGLWSLTYFITLLPISLNGLGVQELSFTFLFTHFGGIDPSNSLTIALLLRVFLLFSSLPGVLFIPEMMTGWFRTRSVREKHD